MIPAPVYACSVHMLGAWFLVTEAGAIACPTRAVAERVRYLISEHGMVDGDLPATMEIDYVRVYQRRP